MLDRVMNILIAFDQFAWVLLTLGHGSPDETLSAAAYRLWLHDMCVGRFFKPIIDWVFSPLQKDHCTQAFNVELAQRQLPKEYQSN